MQRRGTEELLEQQPGAIQEAAATTEVAWLLVAHLRLLTRGLATTEMRP